PPELGPARLRHRPAPGDRADARAGGPGEGPAASRPALGDLPRPPDDLLPGRHRLPRRVGPQTPGPEAPDLVLPGDCDRRPPGRAVQCAGGAFDLHLAGGISAGPGHGGPARLDLGAPRRVEAETRPVRPPARCHLAAPAFGWGLPGTTPLGRPLG